MNRRRGPLIALLLVLLFVAACVWLPLGAALGLGALFMLASVALFRSPAWRNSALVLTSVLIGLAGFQVAFGLIDPGGPNFEVVKVATPERWAPVDPVLGYRPRPDTAVDVRASWHDQLVFHQTYTIDASGARATPGSGSNGPTWLFMGDSFVFGEGLGDSETLPSQFARLLQPPAHVVNLGVPGYGPNHLVRAMESDLYDRYVVGTLAAAVTWISPPQMLRVTGDGGWLTLSPHYELTEGPSYTGSFLSHRLRHPLEGVSYFARSRFAWVRRIVGPGLEREQQALFVALLARLQDLVRQKWKAPLVIVYDFPDGTQTGQVDAQLQPVFEAVRALGAPMVSMRALIDPRLGWPAHMIPHDGHPNVRMDRLVAKALFDKAQELHLQ